MLLAQLQWAGIVRYDSCSYKISQADSSQQSMLNMHFYMGEFMQVDAHRMKPFSNRSARGKSGSGCWSILASHRLACTCISYSGAAARE